jgi:hypothetical protein
MLLSVKRNIQDVHYSIMPTGSCKSSCNIVHLVKSKIVGNVDFFRYRPAYVQSFIVITGFSHHLLEGHISNVWHTTTCSMRCDDWLCDKCYEG